MNQFLPRGFLVSEGNRIKKLVADGNDWQIYLTNADSYVLAAKPELYSKWISDCFLPTGLFTNNLNTQYWVFQSTGHYIVSSLAVGPYPDNSGQIEAFSIAFKTATDFFNGIDLSDAIYIEEYSIILPVSFSKQDYDYGTVYGKWLTCGISISIEKFERVSTILSWMPKEALIRSARLAGFSILNDIQENAAFNAEEERYKKAPALESGEKELEKSDQLKEFKLVGRPELEQFFKEHIIDVVLHQEQYQRMGIAFPGATILYGPPGCGKTFAVEKLAEYLGWQRFDIDSSVIASPYIHDTSKKISAVFRAAIKAAPSIIVIDEMEAFLSDRRISGASDTHHVEEVAEFLRRIPEAISNGVLVFAMTNMIDSIDPAILRRGRFDHIIEVKMASAAEVEALLKLKLLTLPVDDTVDASAIAKKLDGHPMSDITFVLREAGRYAVRRNLEYISADCFNDALESLPKKKAQTKIGFGN